MKTLDEHNKEVVEANAAGIPARKNGIACPNCGEELADTAVQSDNPPLMGVWCGACGYRGGRLMNL